MKKIITLCLIAFLGLTTVQAQTNNALNFSSASSQYVSVPHSSIFNITSQLTIEMWMKTSDGSEQYFTTKGNDSWYVAINGGGSGFGKVTFFLNGTGSGWLTSTQTVNDGNWHHIACTYNGSNRQIYIDGVLSVSATTTGNISTGTSNISIGRRETSSFYFNGQMDELRFWNVARTQSQIQTNMNVSISASSSNLAAYYKFDNGTGTTLTDATSNANNGTLQNTPTWVTSGVTVYNLLDNVGLSSTTSASAFSLRKLSTTYNGSAIQVRRSSDNTTQNIGFTASGNLDTAALKTFVGANNGFVSIWYDQSGNGNNAANGTAAAQPSIVTSGIINRIASSGQPVVTTTTTSQSLNFTVSPGITGSNLTANAVAYMQNTTGIHARLVSLSNGSSSNDWDNNSYVGAIIGNSTANQVRADRDFFATSNSKGLASFASNTPGVITSLFNGTNHQMIVNGVGGATVASSGAFGITFGRLFNHSNDAGPAGWAGGAWEIIVFPSALSTTDRQTVESNQLAYYGFTNLSNLTISSGTLSPAFAAETTAYSASVSNATTSLTVTPTLLNTSSTIQARVNGGSYATVASGAASTSLSLNVGSNTIDVRVTAQDGTTTKTYSITVTRNATLDNVGLSVSNPSPAAFSLRKLSSSYSGSAIQVRRSSDNTTQDIGFTASGNLDTAALKTFVGANNGFITIWYDQSGNNRNATQATNSSQPQIVSTGSVIRSNGNPTVYFNSTSLATASYTGYSSAFTLEIVAGIQNNTSFSTFGAKATGGFAGPWEHWHQYFAYGNNITQSSMTLTNPVTSASGFSQWSFAANVSGATAFRNGIANGTGGSTTYADGGGSLYLGTRGDGATTLNGWISEYVTIGSVLSTTDRQAVENNQLAYYNFTNANLSAISLSNGTLSPSFATNTTAYTATVTNAISSITVTPTVEISGATVQVRVNGASYATVASGAASSALSLNVGSNTVDVTVTALNGTTVKTYTVTVTRSASTDATLSALTISSGTLSPTFASGTTSYTNVNK